MSASPAITVCMLVCACCTHAARAGDPPVRVGCGYVLNALCPGCSPNNPGACGCGPRNGQCDCVDQNGNLQTGNLIQCLAGPYAVIWDMNGRMISRTAPEACGTVSSWLGPSGATKCDEVAPCTGGACQWEITGNISAAQYLEGGACRPI